ncbi:hypothetical protein V8F33_001206 [Rhypophila sp. PSN 637]
MIRLLTRCPYRFGLSAGVRVGTALTAVPVPRLIGTLTATTTADSTSTRDVTNSSTTATAESTTTNLTGTDVTPINTTSSSTSNNNGDSSSTQLDLSEYMERAKAEFSSRFPQPRLLGDRIDVKPSHCLSRALLNHLPAECLPSQKFVVPHWTIWDYKSKGRDGEPILGLEKTNRKGETLPQGHHLLYFPPTGELMSDGAEKDLCPGPPFVRRLWLGGSLKFSHEILFDPARIWFCLEDVGSPTMSANSLPGKESVSVQIKRHYFANQNDSVNPRDSVKRVVSLEETRELLFLRQPANAPPEDQVATKSTTSPVQRLKLVPDSSFEFTPDHTLLFQFSALTNNAHAIHLDADYARNVEGYKGLLVHGPLTLILMLSALQRECHSDSEAAQRAMGVDRSVPWVTPWVTRSIEYRNIRPLYAGQKMKVCVKMTKVSRFAEGKLALPLEKNWKVWIEDSEGRVAAKATAVTLATQPDNKSRSLSRGYAEILPSPAPEADESPHEPLSTEAHAEMTPSTAPEVELKQEEKPLAASRLAAKQWPQEPPSLDMPRAKPQHQHSRPTTSTDEILRQQLQELILRQNEFSEKLRMMENDKLFMKEQLLTKEKELMKREIRLLREETKRHLKNKAQELWEREEELKKRLEEKAKELWEKQEMLSKREGEMQLMEMEKELMEKEKQLVEPEKEIKKEEEKSLSGKPPSTTAMERQIVNPWGDLMDDKRAMVGQTDLSQVPKPSSAAATERKSRDPGHGLTGDKMVMRGPNDLLQVPKRRSADAMGGKSRDPWHGLMGDEDPFQAIERIERQMETSSRSSTGRTRGRRKLRDSGGGRTNKNAYWGRIRGLKSSFKRIDVVGDGIDTLRRLKISKLPPPKWTASPATTSTPPSYGSWATRELEAVDEKNPVHKDEDPFSALEKQAIPSATTTTKNTRARQQVKGDETNPAVDEKDPFGALEKQAMPSSTAAKKKDNNKPMYQEEIDNFRALYNNRKDREEDTNNVYTRPGATEGDERSWLHAVERDLQLRQTPGYRWDNYRTRAREKGRSTGQKMGDDGGVAEIERNEEVVHTFDGGEVNKTYEKTKEEEVVLKPGINGGVDWNLNGWLEEARKKGKKD